MAVSEKTKWFSDCTITVVDSCVLSEEERGREAADQWDPLQTHKRPKTCNQSCQSYGTTDNKCPTSVPWYSCGAVCHSLATWFAVKRYRHTAGHPKHGRHYHQHLHIRKDLSMNNRRSDRQTWRQTVRPRRLWIQWSQPVSEHPLLLPVAHYTAESCSSPSTQESSKLRSSPVHTHTHAQ